MKAWIKKAGVRAIKTVAQAAVAMIGTAAVMQEVDWCMVVSASALAGVLSLLTSVAGLPELTEAKLNETYVDNRMDPEDSEIEVRDTVE
ncbi:holin [Hominibacterium faecale]|uniref:holin n=1 Tax=Hominibacterium faecale TaxID=2839743 RepID=UPI002F961988